MSLNVQYTILQDNATPAIRALMGQCSPPRLARILRDPLRGFWRDHLKNLPGNRRGWPSTGFWEEAADSVQAVATDTGVVLRADKQGLRQRYYGGVIPQEGASGKKLTIPISPLSYGKTAAEFPDCFLLVTKKAAYLVQYANRISATGQKTIRQRGAAHPRDLAATFNFLFILMDSVTQDPNPNVVPTSDEFAEVAMSAIQRAVTE